MPRALRQRHEPRFRSDDKTCRVCGKVYKQAGRLENHLQDRHPEEYAARNKQIDDPSTRLPTPPAAEELPVDPFVVEREMLKLYPNLDRPGTRIRTTLRIEEFEYDSDGHEDDTNSGENANLDPTTGKKPLRYPTERYPRDPIEIGYDGSNREGTLLPERRWHPFRNGFEFKLGRYILDNNLHQKAINDLFNLDLARDPPPDAYGGEGVCFTSAYTYEKMLDDMDPELSMKAWIRGAVNHPGAGLIEFRYRLLEDMIRHLFKQPSHEKYIVYTPVKEFDQETGYRVYSDLHTAQWWWHMQEIVDSKILPDGTKAIGRFVIPIIFGSDETFQTNFSGDKNIWPLIMSIGNFPVQYRNTLVNACWRLMALLPVRPKRASKVNVDEEKRAALKTVQDVLAILMKKELVDLWETGITLTCPDGKVRIGYPVVVGWIGDYPEYCKLFTTIHGSCPICVAPAGTLDAHPTTEITHRSVPSGVLEEIVSKYYVNKAIKVLKTRSSQAWQTAHMDVQAAETWSATKRINLVSNTLWQLPEVTPVTLWKPDLLHTMDLGLIKHCCEWMFNMLDEHGKPAGSNTHAADLFDVTWTAVSPHPDIIVPKKKYRAVKQWSGKEYRNAASLMGAVLEATLEPYPSWNTPLEETFERTMDCVVALLNFYLCARLLSHTFPPDAEIDNAYRAKWDGVTPPDPHDTLSYMQHYLSQFHNNLEIFLKYRATAGIKRKAATYAKGEYPDLSPEDKAAMPADELKKRNALKKQAETLFLMENATYSFPKMHMVTHFAEIVPRFGSLGLWTTSIVELHHQPLNTAYDSTNKVDAMDQTLRFASHKDMMAVKIANFIWLLQANILPEKEAREIGTWLNIYTSRKARLRAAKAARDRMQPADVRKRAQAKAKKRERKEQQEEAYNAVREKMGFDSANYVDPLESDDDDEEEEFDPLQIPDPEKHNNPGRLLRNRMLDFSVEAEPGMKPVKLPFNTLEDIERILKIDGLKAALFETLKYEPASARGYKGALDGFEASPYTALRIRRPVYQSPTELENHIIRCTYGEPFRTNKPRSDFVVYNDPAATRTEQPIMKFSRIGKVIGFFRIHLPTPVGEVPSLEDHHKFAVIRTTNQLPMTESQQKRGFPRFEWAKPSSSCTTKFPIKVIRIGSIQMAASMVPILPSYFRRGASAPETPEELWASASKFIFNTKVDRRTFYTYY